MKVIVPPRKVFQYRKADYEGMKKELRATLHDFQQMAETEDTEHLWTTFKKKTHTLMDKFIPSKILRGNKSQKPWVLHRNSTVAGRVTKVTSEHYDNP